MNQDPLYSAFVIVFPFSPSLGTRKLQQPNGCFAATEEGGESDTRFLFCACAISAMLNDWSAVDVDLAEAYVISCMTYEGGIALTPGKITTKDTEQIKR